MLGCASVVENVGGSIDPGYKHYQENRTPQQRMEDERRSKEVERQMSARESTDRAMRRFNRKADSLAVSQDTLVRE